MLRAGFFAALAALASGLAGAATADDLAFEVREGLNLNRFLQDGDIAAHLVLRSGPRPRILVAFPAGNSGVGLWFEPLPVPAHWTLVGDPQPIRVDDARGRVLRGMSFVVAIDAPSLVIRQAVLSSVRVLRDFELLGKAPALVAAQATVRGDTLRWARDRLDDAPGYQLDVRVAKGDLSGDAQQPARIHATEGRRIELEIRAVSGETPLTPFPVAQLLTSAAAPDPKTRHVLEFLSYREKFLAGSWRFLTYFGRDTLMSVRLLMPALAPEAVEAGLASVIMRLSPTGQVAHEEDIGEFAILDHLRAQQTRSAAPVYDYRMIDGDFLLAPVAAAWMLDDARGRTRAVTFLAARPEAGEPNGTRLARNLRLVLARAAPFADGPTRANLVELLPGYPVGEWRDSNDGLGGGRYPFDVNAALVPAALEAAARFFASGLLDPYLAPEDAALIADAARMAGVWRAQAARLFEVRVPQARARMAIETYAAQLGVRSPPARGDTLFHAVALDAAGVPVPIMNSDEGFVLLFGEPAPEALDHAVAALMQPFPAGLMTGAGMLVANPVFAPPALQRKFTRDAYHGTVVWSWQQLLFAAGLERQLGRCDLPLAVRAHLAAAQAALWKVIQATRPLANSELWSWQWDGRQFEVAPFGAHRAHADESNAAQLWSTAALSVRPPSARPHEHSCTNATN
ncbi:MAG: hypothetical protein CMLOHMNK_02141 [Steroidobacteraceae bacterium]|nr:hypothetical protein [Steroidobacteraceae bacterium]